MTYGLLRNWNKNAHKVAVMFELSQLFNIYNWINKVLTYWDCTGEHGSQMFVRSPLTLQYYPLACLIIIVIMLHHLNKNVRTVFFFCFSFLFCVIHVLITYQHYYQSVMTSRRKFWLCFQEHYA